MFSQIDFDVSSLTLYCAFQKFLFQLDFDYYQPWHFLSLILIFNSTSRNTNIDHALPLCSDQTNPISFVYVDHKQKSMLQFVSLLITTFPSLSSCRVSPFMIWPDLHWNCWTSRSCNLWSQPWLDNEWARGGMLWAGANKSPLAAPGTCHP